MENAAPSSTRYSYNTATIFSSTPRCQLALPPLLPLPLLLLPPLLPPPPPSAADDDGSDATTCGTCGRGTVAASLSVGEGAHVAICVCNGGACASWNLNAVTNCAGHGVGCEVARNNTA
jgi:hypothetical protein